MPDETKFARSPELRRHYRELGLCTNCGRPRRGKLWCARCRGASNRRRKALRRWFMERGFCGRCMKNEVELGRRICLGCRIRRNGQRPPSATNPHPLRRRIAQLEDLVARLGGREALKKMDAAMPEIGVMAARTARNERARVAAAVNRKRVA